MPEQTKTMTFNIQLSDFPEHCNRIGNIIALWNTIERLFSNMLMYLLGPQMEQSLSLLGSIESSRARLSFVSTAGETTLGSHELRQDFDEVMKLAGKGLALRNKYAHAIYAKNEKGQLCMLDMRYNWITTQKGAVVVRIADLDAAWEQIETTYVKAAYIIKAFEEQLPPEYTQALAHVRELRELLGNAPEEPAPPPT